jgi:hypothetical protein
LVCRECQAVGKGQLAKGSWRLAVGSWQVSARIIINETLRRHLWWMKFGNVINVGNRFDDLPQRTEEIFILYSHSFRAQRGK